MSPSQPPPWLVRPLQSNGPLDNFYPNVRSMAVATFTMLILYFLYLLLAYLSRSFLRPSDETQRSSQSPYQRWKSRGAPESQPMQISGSAPLGKGYQGVNSEIGTPHDYRLTENFSRAADVAKLGFVTMLGGTLLNALSFDPAAGANATTWVSFGLFTLWSVVTLFTRSRWVPLVFGVITFGVVIATYSQMFSLTNY